MGELHNHTVTTRKPHRCAWCPEPIEAKQKALSRAYVWEGHFHHDYFHPECWKAMCDSDFDPDFGFDLQAQERGQAINYYGEPLRIEPIHPVALADYARHL